MDREPFDESLTGTPSGVTDVLRQLVGLPRPEQTPVDGGPTLPALPDLGQEEPGRYTVEESIGRGAQSVVHVAFDARLGRRVAFKQIVEALRFGGDAAKLAAAEHRFLREARITGQLEHPGIAPVHSIGRRADGSLYLTQKLVRGQTLDAALAACRGLPDRLALLPALLGVAQAVAHAHAAGVVHRDLKPQNVMLGPLGEVVVLDWGIAIRLGSGGDVPGGPAQVAEPDRPAADSQAESSITRAGSVVGTPAYMSPEQAAGEAGRLDARSDVFSLGVIFHQLLAGRLPRRQEAPPPGSGKRFRPVREVCREAPADLAAVVDRALAPDPGDRYPDAGALAAELSGFLSGRLVNAHAYSFGELARRWARRNRPLLATAVAALLAIGVVSTVAVRRTMAERDRANREAEAATRIATFLTGIFKVSDPSEARGNSVTAREVLDRASQEIETGLERDPLLQAQLMDTIGTIYTELGLHDAARPMVQRSLEARRRLLGPDAEETLHSQRDWADLLYLEGKLREAEAAFREVVERAGRALGPDHRITLYCKEMLGMTVLQLARYPEAEVLLRQVVEATSRIYGPEAPETEPARLDLSVAHSKQRHFAEAAALRRGLLEKYRQRYGVDHPRTVNLMAGLEGDLFQQGEFVAAEALAREALGAGRKIWGPDHPKTVVLMTKLANTLAGQRRFAEAEAIDLEILAVERRLRGPTGRAAAIASYNLACLAAQQHHRDDALRYLREGAAAGYPAELVQAIDRDKDLESLRGDPDFVAIVARAKGTLPK